MLPVRELIMQVDFDVPAADLPEVGIEASSQADHAETENARPVAANDNGTCWPVVPFPEHWYASF
jgi:hypothetical protein